MPAPRHAPAVLLLGLLACSSPTDDGGPQAAELRFLSSLAPVGTVGWPLDDSVVVQALDAAGNPLPDVSVVWSGVGQASPTAVRTDNDGRAAVSWTLGLVEGTQALSATARNLPPITIVASAQVFHAEMVTVGGGFACALTATGKTYCWGDNTHGQIGFGAASFEPVLQAHEVSGDPTFSTISAGGSHVCGLSDGTPYCWGTNESGETGTGSPFAMIPSPTRVQTSLRFTGISAEGLGISANSTCAVTEQGQVWCWGDNLFGKLGDGTRVSSPLPVQVQGSAVFSKVETGYFHACAITPAGALWCWGEQETDGGGLGLRPAGVYTTPVSVATDFQPKDLSLGRDWTCALSLDNQAYCWGTNWFGVLGRPEAHSPTPLPVTGGFMFRALSAASMEENHALSQEGRLYRWGSTGGDASQNSPVPLAPDLEFVSQDPGGFPFDQASGGTCAVHVTGAVYCVRDDGLIRGVPPPAPWLP